MRTQVQQAEIDAYEFHFTFPDPHRSITHCFLEMVHSVCTWTALLCLASPCFTVVSGESEEGHISPVTYMTER